MSHSAQLDTKATRGQELDASRFVRLIDVTLRDGLQVINPQSFDLIPTHQKLDWLQRLIDCGFRSLEVTSFASPKRLPQFADAAQIIRAVADISPDLDIRGYVPNMKGLSRALDAGLSHAVFFIVCSETYEVQNVGRTRQESSHAIKDMVNRCMDEGVEVSGGVGMAFFCPYEGAIQPSEVRRTIELLLSHGVRRVTLADSLGIAGPREIVSVMGAVADLVASDDVELGLHLHNSLGIATATMQTALELGVRTFETTTTGVGGGIAMPGGTGFVPNLSTEAALGLLDDLEFFTGVDRLEHAKLVDEVSQTFSELKRVTASTVVNWQMISPS
jgi:hydroxymethylglutaryl-CoA lyase